ncbi:MAG: hypothetical protein QOJ21_2984 [Solirubrobacteraceae bacterium]|jgi:hypothetical protein|nr:hypothetical protein [Solirubrobacteraceae bacterium]
MGLFELVVHRGQPARSRSGGRGVTETMWSILSSRASKNAQVGLETSVADHAVGPASASGDDHAGSPAATPPVVPQERVETAGSERAGAPIPEPGVHLPGATDVERLALARELESLTDEGLADLFEVAEEQIATHAMRGSAHERRRWSAVIAVLLDEAARRPAFARDGTPPSGGRRLSRRSRRRITRLRQVCAHRATPAG